MSRFISVALLLLTLVGCAAWTTPSTYTNHNTPNGNVVTAQGESCGKRCLFKHLTQLPVMWWRKHSVQ